LNLRPLPPEGVWVFYKLLLLIDKLETPADAAPLRITTGPD
jgi:hypothetical protein